MNRQPIDHEIDAQLDAERDCRSESDGNQHSDNELEQNSVYLSCPVDELPVDEADLRRSDEFTDLNSFRQSGRARSNDFDLPPCSIEQTESWSNLDRHSLNLKSREEIREKLISKPIEFISSCHNQLTNAFIRASIRIDAHSADRTVHFSLDGPHHQQFELMVATKHRHYISSTFYQIRLSGELDESEEIARLVYLDKFGTDFKLLLNERNVEQEIGRVEYDRNILGLAGPRKFVVKIQSYVDVKNAESRSSPENQRHWIQFHNRIPTWNEDAEAYMLKFHSYDRIVLPALNNFQLTQEDDEGEDAVVMEHGKTADNLYSCYFRSPISLVQAFAICLSSYDSWILRE